MRHLALTLGLLALTSATNAATGGPDAPEPVNVVAESGLDVGVCTGGGTLGYPPAPHKGSAYFLLRADDALAARHQGLTSGQAPWLRRLDGPSAANRLFVAQTGERAIVYWACTPGECDSNAVYGAYEPRSGDYLLRVRQGGKATQTLGRSSSLLEAAIACARTHDDLVRQRSAEMLKRQSGR